MGGAGRARAQKSGRGGFPLGLCTLCDPMLAARPQDQNEDHVFMKIETHVYSVDSVHSCRCGWAAGAFRKLVNGLASHLAAREIRSTGLNVSVEKVVRGPLHRVSSATESRVSPPQSAGVRDPLAGFGGRRLARCRTREE